LNREEVKQDVRAALADVLQHLERREAEGLFSSEKKAESVGKFMKVAEVMLTFLDDPVDENLNFHPEETTAAVLIHIGCRLEPELLPYCRLFEFQMQRRKRMRE
jgi:hypothetical protein